MNEANTNDIVALFPTIMIKEAHVACVYLLVLKNINIKKKYYPKRRLLSLHFCLQKEKKTMY
jgi:hypothetical protein